MGEAPGRMVLEQVGSHLRRMQKVASSNDYPATAHSTTAHSTPTMPTGNYIRAVRTIVVARCSRHGSYGGRGIRRRLHAKDEMATAFEVVAVGVVVSIEGEPDPTFPRMLAFAALAPSAE